MSVPYTVGAVGVYDKSRQAATADKWFVIANVILNGNGQRYVKYDTDVYASKEDAEKVALVMALRNAGKDETSHPNEFNAASLVNKIGTSNGMTKTQISAACRGAGSLTEAFKIPAAVTPTGLSTALIGKEMLNFFGEENMVAKGIIKIGTKPGYYVVEWTEGGTTKSVERTEVYLQSHISKQRSVTFAPAAAAAWTIDAAPIASDIRGVLKLLDRSTRLADDGIDGDELIITLKAMGKDLHPVQKDGSRDGFYLATFEGMIDTLTRRISSTFPMAVGRRLRPPLDGS